jgi:hypothetical protein
MTFKDQIKSDALNVFLNTGEFAETVSYTPKGGSAKTIKAVVNRERPDPAAEVSNRAYFNQLEIMIANDATNGIAAINKDGDTVSLPLRPGGVAVTFTVKDILSSDDGMWHLILQA